MRLRHAFLLLLLSAGAAQAGTLSSALRSFKHRLGGKNTRAVGNVERIALKGAGASTNHHEGASGDFVAHETRSTAPGAFRQTLGSLTLSGNSLRAQLTKNVTARGVTRNSTQERSITENKGVVTERASVSRGNRTREFVREEKSFLGGLIKRTTETTINTRTGRAASKFDDPVGGSRQAEKTERRQTYLTVFGKRFAKK